MHFFHLNEHAITRGGHSTRVYYFQPHGLQWKAPMLHPSIHSLWVYIHAHCNACCPQGNLMPIAHWWVK